MCLSMTCEVLAVICLVSTDDVRCSLVWCQTTVDVIFSRQMTGVRQPVA